MKNLDTLRWVGGTDGHLVLIDQTRLPVELLEIECRDVEAVWEAIKMLRVRGAPAIGIAAAYGLCVAMQTVAGTDNRDIFFARLDEAAEYLAASRPTAVNLFWAIERIKAAAAPYRRDVSADKNSLEQIVARLLQEARAIHDEDRLICREMGRHGAALLADGQGVLTHCNAGSLATADYGTALAVIYAAVESGKNIHAYADETRPLLQGARLTAWELKQRGIPVTLICDSMAAQVMREGRVQAVITGADRIAANGDVANKIGTYGLAIVAAAHDVPFYVVAPTSTFDLSIPDGEAIPIEQRDPREITHGFGRQTAPDGIDVYNPAFDVTPARLIDTIICEKGLIRPVNVQRIAEML
jgi:methylthioribose-1-phosphate isomerase